jgi:hypothetical protein
MSLSRAELKKVFEDGGSVVLNGQHITRAEDLPGKATSSGEAAGDADLTGMQSDLQSEVDRLRAENETLRAGQSSAEGQSGTSGLKEFASEAEFRAALEAKTVDELKQGAETRGVDLGGATKKAEIIEAIVKASGE